MPPEIPFNHPYVSGKEQLYLSQALDSRKWSGDGPFTRRAQGILESRYGFKKALLTSSCTDALEMAAILSGIGPGDEVIVPSYTFVSSVNPFMLRGAQPVFIDSTQEHPNLDVNALEGLVTPRTKVIVAMHYSGVACPMAEVMELANRKGLLVVEDAAQCIDAFYEGRPLGSMGHFGTLSFHETKNITSGEGGVLLVNDPAFEKRAEIIREKGTNRMAFFRGEVAKYGWVDIGSSFLLSEFNAAVLTAQLESLDEIQSRRVSIWGRYHSGLSALEMREDIQFPSLPAYATNNAHMFYLVLRDLDTRSRFLEHMKARKIHPVFHYQSLHQSSFFASRHDGRSLPHADRYSDCLVRLPFYMELSDQDIDHIVASVQEFFRRITPMKRVAILQSNYIPWKGYFDIIQMVDEFILLDEVQYTKNDWRNRNKIKTTQGSRWLTIPVFHELSQRIDQTRCIDRAWRKDHWASLSQSYARAAHFREFKPRFEHLYLEDDEMMLSRINHRFITSINEILGIRTRISRSSDYGIIDGKTNRLVDLCQKAGGTEYLTGPAARGYLDEGLFQKAGITVDWMDYSGYREYTQLFPPFDHCVSILDLLFNEGPNAGSFMKSQRVP